MAWLQSDFLLSTEAFNEVKDILIWQRNRSNELNLGIVRSHKCRSRL